MRNVIRTAPRWCGIVNLCIAAAICGGCDESSLPPIPDAGPSANADGGTGSSPQPNTDAGSVLAPPPMVGEPIGDLDAITHAMVEEALRENLTLHIDGLESSISFLEGSLPISNLYALLFVEDDDASEFDIDLSEIRDGAIDLLVNKIFVEANSTLAEDGLALTYALDATPLCEEEAEEGESADDARERRERIVRCTDDLNARLEASPIRFVATMDGPRRLNLSIQVGNAAVEAVAAQIHPDQISATVAMSGIRELLSGLIAAEDFPLPATMEGSIGGEIRREAENVYRAFFTVFEDIQVESAPGEATYSVRMNQAAMPGEIRIDGNEGDITGELDMDEIAITLPWQDMVNIFFSEEGRNENICEELPDGSVTCRDEWIEPDPPPTVDGTFRVDIPGVHGQLEYLSSTDEFRLIDLNLGNRSTTVSVDEHTIVQLDINPEDGRTLNATLGALNTDHLQFTFAPRVDVRIHNTWAAIAEPLGELPNVLMNDRFGIRFEPGAMSPPQLTLRGFDSDEIRLQVTSGELTLWSDNMPTDVVVSEGQCFRGRDTSMMTDEERDALHALFGEIEGGVCE